MTGHQHHLNKSKESYCFAIEDAVAWCVGWVEGCIVGCCMAFYMDDIVDTGIAEEMVMGMVEGYQDVTYVERKTGFH